MTAELAPLVAPAARDESGESRWTRWSDRLNPIVVREVQQALRGRAFVLSVFAALIVVVVIALVVASDFDRESSGRNAFDAGLATLVPLLLFVLPMQAYHSMRHELKVGMVEQLLLSELRPWRIVVGKLSAAMVQFVLYVSVLSPLLATSYLLRGVELPVIGISLIFAALFCVVATAFAISSAAQGMIPAMQGIANLAVAVGLAMASFGFIGYVGSGEYGRNVAWLLGSGEMPMIVSMLVLGGVASCVLSGLTAASFLAHAYENKSTGFRIFLFGFIAVGYGWIALFVPAASRGEVYAASTVAMMIGATAMGIFMVTEQSGLSPRVQAHVPKSPALALLVAPLLPGRDRGMLCFVVAAGGMGLVAWSVWPSGSTFAREAQRFVMFVFAYAVIYLSLGKWVRARLPASVQGNHLGRFAIPMLVFLFCIVPVLIDVFVQGGVRSWHPGHLLNPFWTIERHAFRRPGEEYVYVVSIAALVLLATQVPSMVRGVREVLQASAQRRARAAALVEDRGVA